jgi:hypothetical protein
MAVALALARTEKKSFSRTATIERLRASTGEVLLYHALVVRLSPSSPTESSVQGWWIPRRQKQREPTIDRTNNQHMELTRWRQTS